MKNAVDEKSDVFQNTNEILDNQRRAMNDKILNKEQ